MADIQEIYSILLSRNYQEELFSDLPGKRKREKGGRETLVDCPICNKADHFSYSRDKPVWRCWSCGNSGSWISYLTEVKRQTFLQALLYLASKAGVDVSPKAQATYKAYTRKADLLEEAQAYFQKELDKKEGEPVFNYLTERGYSAEDIYGMELGAYTDRKGLQDHLRQKGFTDQEIRDSGVLTPDFGEIYQLTMLWRDSADRGMGLACRAILSEEELKKLDKPKYKYSTGLQKDKGLIGLTSVRGSQAVILVEAVIDALYINHKGKETKDKSLRAVGTGGASLSEEQIQALKYAGAEEVLLALDMDKAGQKATETIIKKLDRNTLRPYVVSLPDGYKDPDELIRKEGAEAFQEALRTAEAGQRWMAKRILSKYDTSTDRGLDQALREAFYYARHIPDPIDARRFYESLREQTGLSETNLSEREEVYYAEWQREVDQDKVQKAVDQLQASLKDGFNYIQVEKLLREALKAVDGSPVVDLPQPYLLEDLIGDLEKTPSAMSSGYQWLDDKGGIPAGALTIIAGRPGQGKTTFQINLLVNMLRRYPDKKFYFFTYEEPKKAVSTKIIIVLAGAEIQRETNYNAYVNYLKKKRGSVSKIDQAVHEYEVLSSSGRLLISDDMYGVDGLASAIEKLSKKGDTGAVFIDYIQRIPVQTQQQRYLDIKLISDTLLRQAVSLDIPIIMGAQIKRQGTAGEPSLADLREGGDIEQDANLVLSLYTDAIDKLQEDTSGQKKQLPPVVEMKVSVLKNRGGTPGVFRKMDWTMPIYTIQEKEI